MFLHVMKIGLGLCLINLPSREVEHVDEGAYLLEALLLSLLRLQ